MKYVLLRAAIVLILAACDKPPYEVPAIPQRTWIDQQMHTDTIITNVNDQIPIIYYAMYQWQQSPDISRSHGYRFIAIAKGDSILVKRLNNPSTNYDGPFLLEINDRNDTLRAQNFLDTATANPARVFVLLK